MPYLRKRGRQLVLVHGQRSPSGGQVEQRVLFVFFSQAEAKDALGDGEAGMDAGFRILLEEQYPQIRFDWKKIRRQIASSLGGLPPEYEGHEVDRRAGFRKDLGAFVRRLVLTDPRESPAAATILREHWMELEYVVDHIQGHLKLAQHPKLTHWKDRGSRWRFAELGSEVPSDAEEQAAGYFERGEFDRAETVFKLLVENFDRYAEGYNYLGLIALRRGRLKEAVLWFEKTVQVGRNLFPARLGRSHYWTKLETRPYMRGLSNLAYALGAVGRQKEALEICDRLEGECGDEFRASSHRAALFLGMGKWSEAAEQAEPLVELHPSESFVAAFAYSEMKRWEEALASFLHGALNHPDAAPLLAGRPPKNPTNYHEQEDQAVGRNLRTGLSGYFSRQSPASRGFFRRTIEHARIRALIAEIKAVKAKRRKAHRSGDRKPYARLQEMHSVAFARARAAELVAKITEGR